MKNQKEPDLMEVARYYIGSIWELNELPEGSHRTDKPIYAVRSIKIDELGGRYFKICYIYESGYTELDGCNISYKELTEKYHRVGKAGFLMNI